MSDAHRALVLGMPLLAEEDDPIMTAQPLEAVIVVKALDEDGDVGYYTGATFGLNSIECLGMTEYAALKLRSAMQRRFDDERGELPARYVNTMMGECK